LQPPEKTSSAAELVLLGIKSDIFTILSAALVDKTNGVPRKDIGVLGNFADDLNTNRKLLTRIKEISQRISRNYNLLLLANSINQTLNTSPRHCAKSIDSLSLENSYEWASFWAYELREVPPAKPTNLVEFTRAMNPIPNPLAREEYLKDALKHKDDSLKAALTCLPSRRDNIFVTYQMEQLRNVGLRFNNQSKSFWDKFIEYASDRNE
jgi:hypothetical protein